MGRNSKRRRTLAAQTRPPGYAGEPDPSGNRAARRRAKREVREAPSLQDGVVLDRADPASQ